MSAPRISFLLPLFLTAFVPTGCNGEPRSSIDAPGAIASDVRHAATDSLPEPDSLTQRLFDDVMDYAREHALHEQPLGQVMQQVGLQFRAKPYLAGVLDAGATETLVCRLDGFDCVTFLESALALGRTIRAEDYSWETYAEVMRDQRYRGGEMDGYCSRLHYFTDWIGDNERRENVRDITRELGGVPLDKTLNFMSTHRESYPRFATNDSVYQCILEMEEMLRDHDLYYIPEDRIAETYDRLQAGDIVATATDIDGLDVTHTGLVYEHGDGRIGLLHASTTGGVKVSPDLQSYVQDNRSQIGIVVARPVAR